jgi:hypothetical protein
LNGDTNASKLQLTGCFETEEHKIGRIRIKPFCIKVKGLSNEYNYERKFKRLD